MTIEAVMEPKNEPTFTTIDMSNEVKRAWGKHWNEPEVAYEFQDGKRKFTLQTGDAAIYSTSPDFPG